MIYKKNADGDNVLSLEQAKIFTHIKLDDDMTIYPDIIKFLNDPDSLDWPIPFILYDAEKACGCCEPFAYYVNNVTSCIDAPGWLWTFACDYVYWLQNQKQQRNSPRNTPDMFHHITVIVWRILNSLWYYDFVDKEWVRVQYFEDWYTRESLFLDRIRAWFPMLWHSEEWSKWEDILSKYIACNTK